MMTFDRLGWRGGGICFEWHHFKGNTKYLGHFFSHQPGCLINLIACTSQTASDDLLAEELRSKGAHPNDVCDRVTIPSFRQHGHADYTAHIAAWGVKRPSQFIRQIDKPFWENVYALHILGP